MNEIKRKYTEAYTQSEIQDKRLKTEPIHPQIPVEVWTRIGDYLDDQSRLNLSSTSTDFESDIFWSYFDRNGRLQLKDLSDYPPKLRYFFKKKLLALLMLPRKATMVNSYLGKTPYIDFAKGQAKKYLVSKETRKNKDSLSHLKCHLSDIFSWSTTKELLGEGKWPEILDDISISVIQGSTPFEKLVAGWVAARKSMATARSYFDRAYRSIKETYLIACTDPSPYSEIERSDLAAMAAEEGYFLPLETLLRKKNFDESHFEELKKHPPTLAWKANYLFKEREEFKEAAKYYDHALQGYIEKSRSDFSSLGRGFLKSLKRAIYATFYANEHQKVCHLYEITEKIYAAKNLPIPTPLLYPFAMGFCNQHNWKKTILCLKEWVKDKNSEGLPHWFGNAFAVLSYCYEKLSKYEKALANGRQAIETYRKQKECIPPNTLALVGDFEASFGNNTRALDDYAEAESGYKKEGMIPPDFLFKFAKFYKKINHLDSSLKYLEKARLAFQTTSQSIPNAVYLEMALIFEAQDEQEKALQSYLKITIDYQEVNEEEFLESYAKISVKFSKLKEALASYRAIVKCYNTRTQALPKELYEDISFVIHQVENNPPLPEVLLALGKLYLELNEKDKAFASLASFFQTINSQTHSLEFAETAQLMAALCWEMQKMPLGLEYVSLAVQAYELQGMVPASLYERRANFHHILGDFASANVFFGRAFEAYEKSQVSPSLESLLTAALTERQLGHLDKCLSLLRFAVETSKKITPPDPNFHLKLAMVLHEEGQDEEAAEAYYFAMYGRNINISPASIVEKAAELSFKIKNISYALYFYKVALTAYVENKFPIPAAILERVKDLNEITSEMSLTEYDLDHLVYINQYSGNLEKAASVLELLLENPAEIVNKNFVRQNLLSCYVSLQNHDKVFEITDQVFQRHLVSVSVPFKLYKACGEAHFKLGRPDVAAKFFAFAIHALELPPYHKQSPNGPLIELYRLLGLAHEKMGEASKAVEMYNLARTQSQKSLGSVWLRKIAKKNSDIGNIEEAIFCYEEACRACMTEEQAIPLEILTEIEKIVQGGTDFTTKALFCLAEIYFKFGKFENAIRYYKMNVSNVINKKSEYYYNSIFHLARSYEAQGKLKNALKFYKLARDVFSSLELPIKDILSKISDVHFQLQNYKSAQKYFDQACELSTNKDP